MLKSRIVTAAVLLPLFVMALFMLTFPWLSLLFGLFVLLAAWEWTALAGLKAVMARMIYVAGVVVAGAIGTFGIRYSPIWVFALIGVAALWWIWCLIYLLRGGGNSPVTMSVAGRIVSGFLILVPTWLAALYLYAVDPGAPALLLYVFGLVWSADTGAYFAGRALGRVKLAPAVSPSKTVEGVVGGLLSVVLLAIICGITIWEFSPLDLGIWVVITVVTALFSVVGDLMESKYKRIAHIKDSGGLLPGHGGILDRIDAFTAAAPIFAVAWTGWMR